MDLERSLRRRVGIHAALSDVHRLEIVDALALSDLSPSELGTTLSIGSNLLAHHLGVLEEVGLIERVASAGDGRRRYVRLLPDALSLVADPAATLVARNVLFVCSENSARSQLAAALWNATHDVPATSAGTRPAERVRREAVKAADRAGLNLRTARTRSLGELSVRPDLVVTVCDVAREELSASLEAAPLLHWSVSDPALVGTPKAFDTALAQIASRVGTLAPRVHPPSRQRRPRP